MTVRPSMKRDLLAMHDINGGNIINSMWVEYLNKEYTKKFIDYLKNRNIDLYHIRTSGQLIYLHSRKWLALSPKYIVPIYTFEKDKYKDLFNTPVIELEDKETREV